MKMNNALKLILLILIIFFVIFPVNRSGLVFAEQDTQITIDGSTTVGPIAKAFAEYYMDMNLGVKITVSESGSGNGAKSLLNGTCDIADMSRFMKDKEFKAAVEKGVCPVAHVVALDGLAVVVHPSNPISSISTAQIKDIYTGKIKNWEKLGGQNMPIVVISRDTNSGTYDTFHKLVMKKEKIDPRAEYVNSNGAAKARVQSTKAAIGYVGIGFVDRNIKALAVDGVMPTNNTVCSGRYPVARPLFMFTNGYPKMGSHLYQFTTLYLKEKGQEIISEIGFVSVTQY